MLFIFFKSHRDGLHNRNTETIKQTIQAKSDKSNFVAKLWNFLEFLWTSMCNIENSGILSNLKKYYEI